MDNLVINTRVYKWRWFFTKMYCLLTNENQLRYLFRMFCITFVAYQYSEVEFFNPLSCIIGTKDIFSLSNYYLKNIYIRFNVN